MLYITVHVCDIFFVSTNAVITGICGMTWYSVLGSSTVGFNSALGSLNVDEAELDEDPQFGKHPIDMKWLIMYRITV